MAGIAKLLHDSCIEGLYYNVAVSCAIMVCCLCAGLDVVDDSAVKEWPSTSSHLMTIAACMTSRHSTILRLRKCPWMWLTSFSPRVCSPYSLITTWQSYTTATLGSEFYGDLLIQRQLSFSTIYLGSGSDSCYGNGWRSCDQACLRTTDFIIYTNAEGVRELWSEF